MSEEGRIEVVSWDDFLADALGVRPSPDPVVSEAELGAELYRRFWDRTDVDNPTPFAEQAVAIISMWNNIAADAIAALKVRTGK